MSNTIDQQVVQMKFDNSNFERNVKQSMSTLDKLKSSLNFGDVAQNAAMQLQGVQRRVDSFSMKNMESSLSMISSRFTTMGIIGTRVLQNLTDKAMNFATKLYSSTIGQIKSGGISRAMNIENARFMVEGLNDADASWQALYEDINYGVQDTAYGLDAAAKVAAQLVASGIKAGDQMKSTLRGISGVAAMSNSSYEDIGSIYTTVASNGKLMTEQLRQFSYRGMNASATLAKYLNKSEADINEMVSNGEIDFQTFAAAMDDAFGEHAKDANKTLSGVMMNIKAALSKIGADFVSPLIQQEGPLVNFLNTVKSKINDFRNALSSRDENGNLLSGFAKDVTDSVNNMFKGFNNALSQLDFTKAFAGIVNIFYSVWNVLKGVLSVLIPVGEAFKDILPKGMDESFLSFTERIRDLTSKMKLSDTTAKKLHDTFYAFFSIISKLASNAKGALQVIFETLGTFFSKTAPSVVNTGLDVLVAVFTNLSTALSKVSDILAPVKQGITYLVKQIGENLPHAISNLSGIIGSLFSLGILSNIHNLTKMFSNYSPIISIFQNLAMTLKNYQYVLSIDKIKGIAQALLILAAALFVISSIDSNKLASAVAVISVLFLELTKATNSISQHSKDTTKMKSAFIDALSSIGTIVSLIGFSSALLLLSASVKALSAIDWDGLGRGLTGVTVLIVELTAVSKILASSKDESKKAIRGMFGMIELAIAIKLLVSSVKSISEMKPNRLVQGFGGVTVLIVELTAVSKILASSKDESKKAIRGMFGMIELAIAIKLLVSSVKSISEIDEDSLKQGLAGVTVLIIELTAVSKTLAKANNSISKALASSIVLITFTRQLNKLVSMVESLASMSVSQLAQGLTGLTLIIGELYLSFKMLSNFGSMDWTNVLKLVVILPLLSSSIKTMTKAITSIASLSFGSMITGLIGFAGAIALVTAGLFVLTALGPELLVASGALLMLGGAVALFGVGVAGVGTGILLFVSALDGLANTSMTVGESLTNLYVGIASKLPDMLPAIKEIILGFISVFYECIPALYDGVMKMIIGTLQSVKDNAPVIINLIFDIIVQIFNILSTRVPELTEPLANFVSAIINLLSKVFKRISKEVDFETLVDVVGKMTAICLGMAAIKHFGKAAMEGVAYFTIIITELIGAVEIFGLFFTNDTTLGWIEKGGEMLGKLGEALGKLIGGLVGGGLEQMSDSLPAIGKNLSKFMKNAGPFFEGLSGVGDGAIESVKDLVKIFMLLTANDLIAGDFGIFGSINKWVDNKLGTGTLTDFASQLKDLGTGLKTFSETIGDAKFNTDNMSSALRTAASLASVASKVSKIKKFGNVLTGGNFKSFIGMLPTFGTKLKDFSTNIGADALNIDNMNNAVALMPSIVEIAKNVTAIKNFTGKGDSSPNFKSFIGMLPTFGTKLKDFSTNIGADALNIDNMNNAVALMPSIVEIAKNVTAIKNFTGKGDSSPNFKSFIGMLPTLGVSIQSFATAVTGFTEVQASAIAAVDTIKYIVETFSNVKADNGDTISSFAKGLSDLANTNIQGFIDTFNNAGESVKSAVTGMLGLVLSVIDEYKTKFKDEGTDSANNFITGISEKKDNATTEGKNLAKSAKKGARSTYQGFYNAGSYLVDGFCAGMDDNAYKAVSSGTSLGQAALEAAKESLDEHSPSKESYKVGDFFVDGFVNAISDKTKTAVTTAFNMARSVMNTVSNAINGDSMDSISSGMTLTPVLDTSNMSSYSWSGILNGQLGNLSFTEQTQSMVDVCREIQNGIIDSNNKVISAIDELRTDLGLYYDGANTEVSLYLDRTKLGSAISKNFTRQMSALNKLK